MPMDMNSMNGMGAMDDMSDMEFDPSMYGDPSGNSEMFMGE